MRSSLLALVLLGASSVALSGFAQTPTVKKVPVQPTAANSGSQMYTTYCAACHGADGKGNGPAAKAMKTPPSDLTLISQRNGGKFPSAYVSSILQLGVDNPAHGSSEMPVWGDLLRSLHTDKPDSSVQMHLRIANLSNYLKTIQK